MQINKILNTGNIQFEKTVASTKGSSKEVLNEKGSKSDNLSLSLDSEKLHKLSVKTNDLINQIDSLEREKLDKVKERLNSGFYSSDEVVDKISDNMLKKDSLKNILLEDDVEMVVEKTIDNRVENEEKLNKVKNSLDNKGYENEKVYNQVAKKVIDIYT